MANPQTSFAEALLTEHFRFTPLSLIDEIINTVNAIIYRALQAIESGLLNTPPSTLGFSSHSSSSSSDPKVDVAEVARAEIENGVHQLETLLEATVDKDFDKFEIYVLRNILKVPEGLESYMRLSHYENLNLPIPANAPTPTSILEQRKALQESQKLQLMLEAEHASNTALLSQLKTVLSPPTIKPESSTSSNALVSNPLSLLAAQSQSASSAPLTTNAQFTTSQLPAVRALLDILRPKLQQLIDNSLLDRMDWEGDKEDRRGYVEGVVKRVVRDQVGAVDKDGEMDLGRAVGQDEVVALEGIVGEKEREKEKEKEKEGGK